MTAALKETNKLSINEIRQAAERIKPHVRRTPLIDSRLLTERLGTNVYLKLELLQKTGAFKARGAFNKMLALTDEQKKRGIVAVSAGNHAQAVAYAARALGQKALILMPDSTRQNYLDKTRAFGAEIKLFPTIAKAFAAAEGYQSEGRVYVHPFDDPFVIAGQGTIGLEILEDVPDVTDVVVSIGGGGLAGGIALAVKSLDPNVNIWGVETKGADSMAQALAAGTIVELPSITSIAKTLGAPSVGRLTFELAKKYFRSVTVVDDSEAITELFYLLDKIKVLAEPAASCTLAAAERLKENFDKTSKVVLVLCGGNIGLDDLCNLRIRSAAV
ncbi:MAG TPA: threonine/serine dehydratase [Pyrinomonadaceae bacterium]|nr:threonine/serine dehydratase [Pyrinomonadaceae bacterium]